MMNTKAFKSRFDKSLLWTLYTKAPFALVKITMQREFFCFSQMRKQEKIREKERKQEVAFSKLISSKKVSKNY